MDCPALQSAAPRAFGLLLALRCLVCGAEDVLAKVGIDYRSKDFGLGIMRRVGQWWVGLVLLVLAGSALAQGWTAFTPEGGRCRIDMPGTPTIETVPLNSPGQTLTMTKAKVQAAGATFFMSWVDYPDRIALSASSDTMLDKVRDGMAAGNTLRGEKKLTLGRALGREFTLVQANGSTTAVRLYWARNRLYQLGVTGRAGIENQPETRHFFESFALVRS